MSILLILFTLFALVLGVVGNGSSSSSSSGSARAHPPTKIVKCSKRMSADKQPGPHCGPPPANP
jgi:hypothetical protein